MASGARNKFGVPKFEPVVFRKQMHCIEESTCDIVGTFRRLPQAFGTLMMIRRTGKCYPLLPLLRLFVHFTMDLYSGR